MEMGFDHSQVVSALRATNNREADAVSNDHQATMWWVNNTGLIETYFWFKILIKNFKNRYIILMKKLRHKKKASVFVFILCMNAKTVTFFSSLCIQSVSTIN